MPVPRRQVPPLQGKRIAITRAKNQSRKLTQALEGLGAAVLSFPTIAVAGTTPESPIPLPEDCDWLVFSSANGVRYFAAALEATDRSLQDFAQVSICAIESATAETLQTLGMSVSLTPANATAEDVGETLAALEGGLTGKRILLPRGDLAKSTLPDRLRDAGAEVMECVVYTTTPAQPDAAAVSEFLDSAPNVITFTSASTAEHLVRILGPEAFDGLAAGCVLASIGPVTTQALLDLGHTPAIEAEQHDIPGLVRAITGYFG